MPPSLFNLNFEEYDPVQKLYRSQASQSFAPSVGCADEIRASAAAVQIGKTDYMNGRTATPMIPDRDGARK
jgi:hypothetical protein